MGIISPVPDHSIAHFNLLERMGEDALGTLYRAHDTKRERTVALTIVADELSRESTRLDALLADAVAAASLTHPNIAVLFGSGNSDGVQYLVHEFVEGTPLRRELASGRINPRRAIEWAGQIADALATMQATGIVHRGLTPDNILITHRGSAKLLRCGLQEWTLGALVRRDVVANPEALAPAAMRIIGYMAPEQVLGENVDARADVFALGAILYEMVTGRDPYRDSSIERLVVNIMTMQPAVASSLASHVPPALDDLLARSFLKDISHRPSIAEFSEGLHASRAELDATSRPGDPTFQLPVDDEADRLPPAVWAAMVTGLAGFAAIAWWSLR